MVMTVPQKEIKKAKLIELDYCFTIKLKPVKVQRCLDGSMFFKEQRLVTFVNEVQLQYSSTAAM